ncbi:helix-turn-helix domain-containing protein [Candidatus Uhrbacteria bacterium]|nr:helix-turn-helix domain-containing protein [Candidatus Uhrbacteria bacterium]
MSSVSRLTFILSSTILCLYTWRMNMLKNRLRILMAEYSHSTGESLSQRDLARATGIAESTISSYVTNKVERYDKRVVTTLINFFGCSVDDFFELQDEDIVAAGELLPA